MYLCADKCLYAGRKLLAQTIESLPEETRANDSETGPMERFRKAEANLEWGNGKMWKAKLMDSQDEQQDAQRIDEETADGPSLQFEDVDTTLEDSDKQKLQSPVTSFAQACIIFKLGHKALLNAQKYYVLEGFVTDHCNIAQDISSLYKALTGFIEEDGVSGGDLFTKMMKRRIDLLGPLCKCLNRNAFEDIYRAFAYELGELHKDMVEVKYSQAKQGKKLSHKKVIELGLEGVSFYSMFLETFIRHDESEVPKLEEDMSRWVMMGRFGRARVFYMLKSPSPAQHRQWLASALEDYRWIVNYSDKHNLSSFDREVELCREMLELLPGVLQRLQA